MREAVIVSTARTPIGKAGCGAFNATQSPMMAIATAAKQIMVDGMGVVVAGGQENISAVQAHYFEWVAAEKDE